MGKSRRSAMAISKAGRSITTLAVIVFMLIAAPVSANRCGSQNPPRCGLDTQTDPPTQPGYTGGGTEASLASLPLFKGTGHCEPGDTEVIYDLGQSFPDNGIPADHDVAGTNSFVIVRAGDN